MLWLPAGEISRVFEGHQAPTAAQISGLVPFGVFRAAPPALADGDAAPIAIDSSRRLITSSVPAPPTPVTSLSLPISIAGAGDNIVIPAPGAGVRIRLVHFDFITAAAVDVLLKSGATALSGTYTFGVRGGDAFDAAGGLYLLELGINQPFIINLSAAIAVGGLVQYTVGP